MIDPFEGCVSALNMATRNNINIKKYNIHLKYLYL